jgi:flagellar export protein FliJ
LKRFKFSLQTLHDLREQERETAERALAQAAAEVEAASANVAAACRAIEEAVSAYAAQMQTKTPDPRAAELHTEYIHTLERRLTEAQATQAERERQREQKRQELLKAAAAAEATAKLREQYYAQYVAELAREEQNLMDELATIATARRLRGAA